MAHIIAFYVFVAVGYVHNFLLDKLLPKIYYILGNRRKSNG